MTIRIRVRNAWNEFKWARRMGEYCDRRLSLFGALWYAIRSELL